MQEKYRDVRGAKKSAVVTERRESRTRERVDRSELK
jgi:hypothetical protein